MKKAQTIRLSGNTEYAKVSDRLKIFREECPHGLVETTPTIGEGTIMFKARILKDKGDESSAEAVAHAIGGTTGQKAFEKIETIAVGRALAMLGYMASGEIASSEEMAEFQEYLNSQKQDEIMAIQDKLSKLKTIEELRLFYKENSGKGKDVDAMIMARKDQLTLSK